jgi:hypothetical protein
VRPAIYIDGWINYRDRWRRATMRERLLWRLGLLGKVKTF